MNKQLIIGFIGPKGSGKDYAYSILFKQFIHDAKASMVFLLGWISCSSISLDNTGNEQTLKWKTDNVAKLQEASFLNFCYCSIRERRQEDLAF